MFLRTRPERDRKQGAALQRRHNMMSRFLKAGALAAAILVSAAGGASAQTVQGILWEGPAGPFVGYHSIPQAVLVFPPAAQPLAPPPP